jgi:hypothetical protein
MELDGEQGPLVGRENPELAFKLCLVISQEGSRVSNRPVGGLIFLGGESEYPPTNLIGDLLFFRIQNAAARCCEHPAVVDTAGSGSVLIDRTATVDEHRTVSPLVITHHDVTFWKPRGREQKAPGYTGQSVLLVRLDVHELRRGTACRAASAGDIGSVFSAKSFAH